MKNILINILTLTSLLFIISGCTTSSIMGLSRVSYVEDLQNQIEEDSRQDRQIQDDLAELKNKDNTELQALQQDLVELNSRMEELQRVSEQVDLIIASLDKTEQETNELQELADEFKIRMATVHEDTLSVLVTALEEYIDDSSETAGTEES
jgi:Skp family chaperone for outer membrane proteins